MKAAIFHATNQRRTENKRQLFEFDARAAEAPRLQAPVMAEKKFLEHENPFAESLRTPIDRIRRVGIRPKDSSENIALEFARRYRSGEAFYRRVVDARYGVSPTYRHHRYPRCCSDRRFDSSLVRAELTRGQCGHKRLPIPVISEDGFPPVATIHHDGVALRPQRRPEDTATRMESAVPSAAVYLAKVW